ncbi:MAG TPA: heme exporter protein CcmB [Myxococcota bacterium]|nr:heme exporter protein CcmB [Myxococcota bacterium]
MIRGVLAMTWKELLIEWRQRSRMVGLFFFSFAVLLLVAFAMPNVEVLRDIAGGALWLGVLLASARSLDQSFAVEMENGALEGLVLWPVPAHVVYYGKALANAIVLLVVAASVTPLTIALYNPPLPAPWQVSGPQIAATLVLGCMGLAAPGTLVAALTTQSRGSSALLPLLFFPLVVPVLMAASRATTLAMEGDAMGQVDDWLTILLAFNLVHWALDGLLFARVVDEG